MQTNRISSRHEPVSSTKDNTRPLDAESVPQWQAPIPNGLPERSQPLSHPTEPTAPDQEDAVSYRAGDQPDPQPPNRAKRAQSDPPKGLHPSVEAILRLRHEREMTQVEMATALGISQRTLQDWERGRRQPQGPGKALLERVGEVLEIDGPAARH